MSNPYNQFNIRPQRSPAGFWADQASAVNSRLNGLNFHRPAEGPRHLQSPTSVYENQRLYNAMYAGTPVMQMDGNTDFSSLGSAAFNQWMGMQYQRYMANCNSGVAVVPVIPFNVGNETSMPRWPANFSDAAAMMQFMPGSGAALLQNQIPVLPPENVAVQQACNMPAFPAISILPDSLNRTDSLQYDANIPFRQVQWMPPTVQKTTLPQTPSYTVENKPNCKTEIASEESTPMVYVDVAVDSSTHLDASDRSGDTSLIDSNVIVVQPVENAGKRKGNQRRSNRRKKVTKLSDKYSLKPCAVPLVPVDALVSDCHESDDNVEESSDNAELPESGDDLSPQPEVSEPANNLDFPVPVALYASPLPELKEMLHVHDIPVMPLLETEDAYAQPEVSELVDDTDSTISVTDDVSSVLEAQEQVGSPQQEIAELADNLTHSTGPVPQVQNNQVVTLPVVQENTDNSPSDQLIGNDEDVGEDFSRDDDEDNCSQNENENASMEQSLGYKVMLTDSDGLLFDMECDDDEADETLRVMLPSKTLETTYEKTGSTNTSKTVASPTKTYASASEHLRKLADTTMNVLLRSRRLETSEKTASATTSNSAPPVPHRPKISNVANLRKVLMQSKSKSKPVRSIVVDDSEDSDNDVMDGVVAASNTNSGSVRTSKRSAASACRDKISATIQQESIDVEGDTDDVETSYAASTANQLETTHKKTASAARTPTSKSRETIQSKQLHKTPTASDSNIVTIDLDLDDSDDVVIVSSDISTSNSAVAGLQHLPAVARNEKSSAKRKYTQKLKHISIKENVNCFLDVPLHSSFFRFEAQSSEVFRLLSMDKSCVPRNVLSELTDLISSVDTVDKQFLFRDASRKVSLGIGGSRTLLFQCLFCPYAEMSAKRVMVHVKQQHRKYASFMQRSLLPSSNALLYIYCRHCNFVTYDSAAMFIHFAVYHRVPGILLSGPPNDIEDDPDWAPVFNRQAFAKQFPFYCCSNCDYIDNEWSRMIQHVLKQHFSKSVFLGCIVKLFMVGWATNNRWLSMAYESLAKEPQAGTQIYACISCKFFSFYPSQTFCHYLASHRSLALLYVCASDVKQCSKQFTSVENVISHLQADHATRQRYQLRCTVTLCDSATTTELHISSGYLVPRDVPVHVRYRSSSASVTTNSDAAIQIADDDDNSDDDDVIILQADPKDNETNDVEPDSTLSEGCNDRTETPGNDDLSSESVVAESDDKGTSDSHSSSQERDISEVVVHCGEENVETDGEPGVGDKTSAVNVNDTLSNVMDTVCTENLHVTEPFLEQNKDDNTTDVADLVNHETLIPTNGESSVASAVYQVDSLLLQEEAVGTNPPLNDVCITNQELLTSTGPDNVELYEECSATHDDTLCSSELPNSPSSPTESHEHSVDLQEELLLLAEGLASDEHEPQDQSSKTKHTVSTSSIISDDESHIIGTENPCFASLLDTSFASFLDTSDDAICSDVVENEQSSHSYVDSLPQETDAVKEECGETSVLLTFDNDCSSDIPVENRDTLKSEHVVEHVSVEQRSDSDSADKPVSAVTQSRFKLLAGYRFPVKSVLTKPR